MKDVDLDTLEAVFRLMKTYGIAELQLGELHAHMPQVVFAPLAQSPAATMPSRDVNITISPDGQVSVPDDFYAAT
jgi:hypothetical protein